MNLSKEKRERLLQYLEKLKDNKEDEDIRIISEIENALNEKKYGLVWEEHSEKVDEDLKTKIPLFTEVKDRRIEKDKEKPYNFLLEGDNLHSLKLLQKTHKGKIDVIYIDPPYNTGNKDFIYNDQYVDKTDGYSHSKWLSFMEKRLRIARELLTEEGVIFISIDDNEQAQLKLLCDEVFGGENFVSTIVIETGGVYGAKSAHIEKTILKVKDYVLTYFKNTLNEIKRCPLYDEVAEPFDPRYGFYIENQKLIPLNDYLNTDIFLKEKFETYDLSVSKSNLNLLMKKDDEVLNYINVQLANKIYKDSQFTLKLSKEIIKEFDNQHIIEYKHYKLMKTKNNKIRHLQSFNSVLRINDEINPQKTRTIARGDLWKSFSKDMGNVAKEGKVDFKNGKKPIRLIKQLLKWVNLKDSIILDFFAGSGTTGHAVAKLNSEDGGNRKYILCTNNENNICEDVTYKRLSNIQNELPHNLKYFKTDYVSKFSDDEVISEMILHIREMIELEHHINLDDKKYVLCYSEEELSECIDKVSADGTLFIASGIFMTSNDQKLLDEKNVNIVEVPEYYFSEELKELGEI